MNFDFADILIEVITAGASDLHLTVGAPPMVRERGKLRPLDMPPLTAADTKALAYSVLTDVQKHRLEETLELDDDVLGRLEGRSSLGRIGIIVHGTAGLFDPGWRGKATLELSNLGIMPVALYPGMRICSFTFEQLSSAVSVPYYKKAGNKYAGQTQPLASKLTSEVNSKK